MRFQHFKITSDMMGNPGPHWWVIFVFKKKALTVTVIQTTVQAKNY